MSAFMTLNQRGRSSDMLQVVLLMSTNIFQTPLERCMIFGVPQPGTSLALHHCSCICEGNSFSELAEQDSITGK